MKSESTIIKKQKQKYCYTREELNNFSKIFYNTLLANNIYSLTKESMRLASSARHLYYSINPPSYEIDEIEEWMQENSELLKDVQANLPELLKTLKFDSVYSIEDYNKISDYLESSEEIRWNELSKTVVNPVKTLYQRDFSGRMERGFGEKDITNAGSHLAWLFVKRTAMSLNDYDDIKYRKDLKDFAKGWLTFLKPIALTSEERELQADALKNTVDMVHFISF